MHADQFGDSIDDIINILKAHTREEPPPQQQNRYAAPNSFRRQQTTRNVGNSAPKTVAAKLNTTYIAEPTIATRYLTFKPYSGQPLEQVTDHGYYFKFAHQPMKLIKGTLEDNGFKETQDKNWTLYWCSGSIKPEVYLGLFAYQKVCHFPKSHEMTRKDLMHRNISKMQIQHGITNFNFIPKTYILPAEMSYFLEEHEKLRTQSPVYICKPHASSQGKGIFITDRVQDILNSQSPTNSYVVSHYIANPMLVNGLKFDLRIYVAMTCINPLRLYVYEDGLGRFATSEFSMDKGNKFVHLTNYSVQKESPHFVVNSDPTLDHVGTKWSLISVFEQLKLHGVNIVLLWERIDDLIIKTVLSVESQISVACDMNVPFRSNCFSLFGFDVLIDQNCKPWLLEVNLSPSLNIDAPIDLKIKGEMIADLFTLTGIVPLDQRFLHDTSYIKNAAQFVNDRLNKINQGQSSAYERYIIRESEDENKRSRKWRRIFPNENCYRYKNYFEQDRPLNIVMRNHEAEKAKSANNSMRKPPNTFLLAGRSKLGQ